MLHRELDAVAKAYIDGYNSAKGIVDDGEMTYIDLGLPSGTLWATRFIGATEEHPEGCRMVYEDAKNYHLPTIQQLDELHHCLESKVTGRYDGENGDTRTANFYGINGNVFSLPIRGFVYRGQLNSYPLVFWLAEKVDDSHNVRVAYDGIWYVDNLKVESKDLFIGSFLSVLTVK